MNTRDQLRAAIGEPQKQYNNLEEAKDDPQGLFKMLLQRKEAAEVLTVKFRGKEIPVRFRLLSMQEEEQAQQKALESLHAQKKTPERLGESAFTAAYQDAAAVEILCFAVQDAEPTTTDDGKKTAYYKLFPSSQYIKQTLTADEIFHLFNLYLHVKNRLHGHEEEMALVMSDLDGWIDRAALGAEYDFLASVPSDQLQSVVQILAMALQRLRHFQPESWANALEQIRGNSPLDIGLPTKGSQNESSDSQPTKSETQNRKRRRANRSKRNKAEPKTITPEEAEKTAAELSGDE